jgi:hypothetical protein
MTGQRVTECEKVVKGTGAVTQMNIPVQKNTSALHRYQVKGDNYMYTGTFNV